MQVLTYAACAPALSWPGAIEALRAGHRLPRPQQGDVLLGTANASIVSRTAHIEGLGFAIKGETIFPANTQNNLPSIQGAVLLYAPDNGALRAVIESRLITQFKTAADSVLGARCLARPDSRHLLIVGAGMVAATLVQAYSAGFPSIERISIWSRRPEQAQALVAGLGALGPIVTAVTDLPGAVADADIVSSATMSTTPLIYGQWVRPGTHIDLIGAYTPEMREADDALIAKSLVYVDYRDTTIDRIGELMAPLASGAIKRDHIRGDLYDLVGAAGSSRHSEAQVTLFKNGGGAHLDLMIAAYVSGCFGLELRHEHV
ncbi:ornithine cyclodeaminase [Devosia epidermidihirudinis]|uniref:Ornithine cyclodeaminase n=1 Tax=Devosia epidermidihirudinis TaxID=1293439 RepID=A0A0F5Q4X3_9HYPH|nr:ornithine cyclodeaminase [Devosia epidermidihirudinis]KKC35957.1 ornithine cyclodeaminase [Devosia epidermidihirudinis]